MTAPLSRVEAIARREADSTGRPHVVLNLNRAGAPLYVCRELRDGIEADRIVSRFDPAPSAPVVEPVASVVGEAAASARYAPVYNPAGTGGYDITDRDTGSTDINDARHWFGDSHFAQKACDALNAGRPCPTMAEMCEAVPAPSEATEGASREAGPRIIATFIPQAWINDYAVTVDAEGETRFDVTAEIRAMPRDVALNLDSEHDTRDELRFAATAPAWVRDWSGPFEVEVSPFDVEAAIASPAPAMVPQPVQPQQGRDVRRGMARCDYPGSWQIGMWSVQKGGGCGRWVARAVGPGTIGDGSPQFFDTLAEAYERLTGEPMPGVPSMVSQPVQMQQACAVRFTVRNDNPATIWNRLAARLGREPTAAEAKAEVRRILRGESV